jgi:kynurenine formamidase
VNDELGSFNLVTESSVLEALSTVKLGRQVELGRVLEGEMPVPEFHGQYFANTQFTLENGISWHERNFGEMKNGYSAQNLRLSMSDQSGTHIDQLNHVGFMENDEFLIYNGVKNSEVITSFGTSRLAMESMPPIICRGVFADIAALHGVETLDIGYAITPEEIDDALHSQNVSVRRGDAVFVNTGWGKHWLDPNALPPEKAGEMLPMHLEMLTKNGIRLVENMYFDALIEARVYEFCFIAQPLKIKGGTGSPLRPVALF